MGFKGVYITRTCFRDGIDRIMSILQSVSYYVIPSMSKHGYELSNYAISSLNFLSKEIRVALQTNKRFALSTVKNLFALTYNFLLFNSTLNLYNFDIFFVYK